MALPLGRLARELYRRERIPPLALWWLAADGMAWWFGVLRRGLTEPLGSRDAAELAIARAAGQAYARRFEILRGAFPALPDDPAKVFGALGFVAARPRSSWVFAEVPGRVPRTPRDGLAALASIRSMPLLERWREVTTHLGEVLIQLTRHLDRDVSHANAILGRICFEGGRRAGERAKAAFGLRDSPESAIEVLRMSEYVFRVNPEHWHATDVAAQTGYLEGTACPWYTAPGWSMMHCGIFGQFQSGICSVFGLRYHLTETIPRHGGTTCRIDLKPIRRKDGTPIRARP